MSTATLTKRKQLQARERIVDAAYQLFDERGFAVVTVADIAGRAEVGRTTFFRHFGDKQEVLFADEQLLAEHLTAEAAANAGVAALTLTDALAQLEPVVVQLCAMVTQHPARYERHERLVDATPELQDRQRRKQAGFVSALEHILRSRATLEATACLAAQIAGACFHAGRHEAGFDPAALVPAVERAFAEVSQASEHPPRVTPRCS